MLNIQFNNYNSYMDLGLVIEHNPNIFFAQKNTNEIYVEGRNGTLTEDLGTYKDINIVINFGFIEKKLYNDKTRLIKHWLNNMVDNKLIFNTDNSIFYKVKNVIVQTGFERRIKSIGRFTVEFKCEPFLYFLDGLNITELNRPNTLYAPEFAVKSYPVIKIYGNGNGALIINNTTIELKNINEYVILDSNMQECYKDINLNKNMIGEFPILQEENKISWTGGIDKIEIIPNWCCL